MSLRPSQAQGLIGLGSESQPEHCCVMSTEGSGPAAASNPTKPRARYGLSASRVAGWRAGGAVEMADVARHCALTHMEGPGGGRLLSNRRSRAVCPDWTHKSERNWILACAMRTDIIGIAWRSHAVWRSAGRLMTSSPMWRIHETIRSGAQRCSRSRTRVVAGQAQAPVTTSCTGRCRFSPGDT